MLFQTEIWKLLAGVAIFLLGMNFLEDSLKQLAGRSFKLFLKKHTTNKLKAVGAGAAVTALLQSSSVVNLMILAFVGSGVLQMSNALAMMLGSNLGTTVTSWIIVTAGFEFNIENIALPVTAIAGIMMAITGKHSRLFKWSLFLFGFGFLFIGLGYMKTGMEVMVKQFDLSALNDYPVIVFVLSGLLITALIQSSSATVAIVLSALHANAFGLYAAMAIVLGSEIGTTVKLILASFNGSPDKRRVAIGNILFNLVTILIILIFLQPVYIWITQYTGIRNNLIALVFFQSMINIVGIILFFPLLNVMARILSNSFKKTHYESLYINKALTSEADLAIHAMENEALNFIYQVIDFSLESYTSRKDKHQNLPLPENFPAKALDEKYVNIKHLHGEILAFYILLQKTPMDKQETERVDQLISCVRNCMYAAKSIKDGQQDTISLQNSSNDVKFNFYLSFKEKIRVLYNRLAALLMQKDTSSRFEELVSIYKSVTENYTITLQELYKESMAENVNEIEISTLINFNREMVTAFKSIIFGIKDYLLDTKQAEYFDELPGFIR
ncbi:MAG: Na/Pi cotransporter family protein [Sphingobacteriales bacterium]